MSDPIEHLMAQDETTYTVSRQRHEREIAALQAQVRVMGEALHNVREYINGRPPIRIASAVYEINKALAALILPAPPKEGV